MKNSLAIAAGPTQGNNGRPPDVPAKLDTLLQTSRLMETGGEDINSLREILEVIGANSGADCVTTYTTDEEHQVLKPHVTTGTKERKAIMDHPLDMGTGWIGEVIRTRRAHLCRAVDAAGTTSIPGLPFQPAAAMAIPLCRGGAVDGLLLLTAAAGDTLHENNLDFLTVSAGQVACLIKEMRLQRLLHETRMNLRNQIMRAEKMRVMGEMASGVFHDFNNILGGVVGRVQLINHKHHNDEDLRESLTQIERIALQGAETVKRLQEFTRLHQQEKHGTTDLNQVVEDALEVTRHRWETQAQKNGISYTIERLFGAEVTVSGIHSQLVDAVANLVLNGIDAMERGGQLTLQTTRRGNEICLCVRDEGKGMTEEEQKKVFSPFYTTKGPKGSGLGLTVVHDIVQGHDGKIRVESGTGKGTTFHITFPASAQPVTAVATAAGPETDGGFHLLVVDDDHIILDVVSEALEDAGHQVDSFSHGAAAIEAINKNQYDVVVTDLGMPEVTGWDVARASKMHEPRLPVVVISGWGEQYANTELSDSGIDAMLAKPFHLKTLRETIEGLAKQSRAEDRPAAN